MKMLVKELLKSMGLEIKKIQSTKFPPEFDNGDIELAKEILKHGYTMCKPERLFSTILAAKYVKKNNIYGDFVECGVWRGGNSIAAAQVFSTDKIMRKIWLFDTFSGMTEPTEFDVSSDDRIPTMTRYEQDKRLDHNEWCFASLEDVRSNFEQSGIILNETVQFIKGDVLTTLEKEPIPEKISVLRLDTDWYESTKKELEVLYPRLVSGGLLLLDDYAFWNGARKAVAEYFENEPNRTPFFALNGSGRVLVKA